MSFMDELKKLTQPYDDDDDFFEGADESSKASAAAVSAAQMQFEKDFGGEPDTSAPEPERRPERSAEGSGLLGVLGMKKGAPRAKAPVRERTVSFDGTETQVILFNPKSFEEARELMTHIQSGRSVVMTLEGLPTDSARRLLDFMSGIAFALQGRITPVSAKTYFVTPQNVDLVGAQAEPQPSSSGDFF